MLWEDSTDENAYVTPRDIIDLSFRIECSELPVDHAWPLYEEIRRVLPWIDEEPRAAIHSIHGAASGNGWIRPTEEPGNLLQLSRRTRLYLRIPGTRENEAKQLCGKQLTLDGHRLSIGDCRQKTLVPSKTIFTRSLSGESVEDEELFTRWVSEQLHQRGIRLRKMLCGLRHVIRRPQGDMIARSVLLSDLEYQESIQLQEFGVGVGQTLGCGIFLPHKSLTAVGSSQEPS